MLRLKVSIRTCIDPYRARKNKSNERVGANDLNNFQSYVMSLQEMKKHIYDIKVLVLLDTLMFNKETLALFVIKVINLFSVSSDTTFIV